MGSSARWLWPLAVAVAGTVAAAWADAELGHIYCLSARGALQAKDFGRAREQIKNAQTEDPGSVEVLLLLGDLAKAQGKADEASTHYAACVKALGAKRLWTRRDLAVRQELADRLLADDDRKAVAELARKQAERLLAAARQAAREGSLACAEAASEMAAALDPRATPETAVHEYASDQHGWSPLLTEAAFKEWRQLRGQWQLAKGDLACPGGEGLLAAPPESSVRDLQFSVRGGKGARVRVDLGRFAVHVDFAAGRVRVAACSPGAAFGAPLGPQPWHAVALVHRSAGLEAVVDGARVGLFYHQKAEGLVGVQITGEGAALKDLGSRPPQAEPEEPEALDDDGEPWRGRRPPVPAPATPDDLIASGRSLEAVAAILEKRELLIPDTLALSSVLEQRGLDRWAAEVCDACLKRGFLGDLVRTVALQRAHLAYRLGDAEAAVKLAREAKDESESTLVLLGDALKKQNQGAEAVAAWRKALALNPLRDDVVARLKAGGEPAERASNTLAPEKAVELLKPTVVVITGAFSGGSGFFLTADGVMLTNNHVIADVPAPKVTAIFREGAAEKSETLPIVDVLATDPTLDLAVVRVAPRGRRFTPVRLAEGPIPKLGSRVLVIGSPGFGDIRLDYTVTQGIVSSGLRTLHGARYVQTDAAINPGNSGGPVFNERGEVIGIATAGILFAQNVGFFVPTTLVRDYLKREGLQ